MPATGPAAARLDRLLGVPLVPRDGARVVRGPRDGRADERPVRLHQGRPRGAARHRRASAWRPCQALTGHGGWPLNTFLTPGGRAVLRAARTSRRSRATGMPSSRDGADGGRRRVARAPRRDPQQGRRRRWSRARRDGPLEPSAEPLDRGRARRTPVDGAAERSTTRRTAASAARRSSRRRRARVPAARAASTEHSSRRATLARDGRAAASTTSSAAASRATRSTRPGRVPHFEKMLYDNALLARAYLHGWQVCGDPRCERVCARDARLGAARDGRPRRRLLLRARRRLRGRRGPVLRLDARGAPAVLGPSSRRRDRVLRRQRARAIRAAAERAPGARARAGRALPEIRAQLFGARARARPPGARRQAADVLERADDRGARRGGRGARASRATSRRRSACAAFVAERACGMPTGGCCAPGRTARRGIDAYLEDYAFLLEALITLYEATFEPRWYREAVRSWPTR